MLGGVFLKTSAEGETSNPVAVGTGNAAAIQDGKVTFKKTLTVNKDNTVTVPNVTFDFSIDLNSEYAFVGGTAPTNANVTGAPKIGKATFTNGTDGDTFDETNKNVSKDVTIDFSEVTFTKVGIYRYKITENVGNNADGTAVDGITNDENATRYLDVYVENDTSESAAEGALKVAYCVMFTSTEEILAAPSLGTGENANKYTYDDKSDGYENNYDVYDLTLEKKVDGSQGDKTKGFTFTVALENVNGANITFTKSAETVANAVDKGNNTYEITLKNDENIKINNIPKGAKYTITETNSDGYTINTAVDTNGDAANDDNTNDNVVVDNSLDGDAKVTYTNTKDGLIPTGVLLTVGAPAVLGIAAVGGILTISIKNKKRNEED